MSPKEVAYPTIIFAGIAVFIVGYVLATGSPSLPGADIAGVSEGFGISQAESAAAEGPKWGFDYCACGLHQYLPPGAYDYGQATDYTNRCYTFRSFCGKEDRDPSSDWCRQYKEITDFYQQGTCNPDWSNPAATAAYCAYMTAGPGWQEIPFLNETCGGLA